MLHPEWTLSLLHLRIVAGVSLMVAACVTALRLGEFPEKVVACLVGACWSGGVIAQLITRGRIEPLIVADTIYAAGLLWVALRYEKTWIWLAIGVRILMFFLHASMYERGGPVTLPYVVGNNVLASATLIILVVGALQSQRALRLGVHAGRA